MGAAIGIGRIEPADALTTLTVRQQIRLASLFKMQLLPQDEPGFDYRALLSPTPTGDATGREAVLYVAGTNVPVSWVALDATAGVKVADVMNRYGISEDAVVAAVLWLMNG